MRKQHPLLTQQLHLAAALTASGCHSTDELLACGVLVCDTPLCRQAYIMTDYLAPTEGLKGNSLWACLKTRWCKACSDIQWPPYATAMCPCSAEHVPVHVRHSAWVYSLPSPSTARACHTLLLPSVASSCSLFSSSCSACWASSCSASPSVRSCASCCACCRSWTCCCNSASFCSFRAESSAACHACSKGQRLVTHQQRKRRQDRAFA